MSVRILNGDCIELMATLDENSVDAIVTDPPYGIGFMGKAWDHADIVARVERRAGQAQPLAKDGNERSAPRRAPAEEAGAYDLTPRGMRAFEEFSRAWGEQALRVLKPGGHLLSFASTRTYHRMVAGLEDAGFEIRDQIGWLFGSGFPKSRNGEWGGTALKPAWEPIVLARKPLIGTVATNWAEHGVGGLNIDACRVPGEPMPPNTGAGGMPRRREDEHRGAGVVAQPNDLGRWPANIIHDGSDEVVAAFPDAPGQIANASTSTSTSTRKTKNVYGALRRGRGGEPSANSANDGEVGFQMRPGARRFDEGSAARFFYCAKASRSDRNAGLVGFATATVDDGRTVAADNAYQRGKTERANVHPTVKPTALMRYLCRLVTPAGGLVLDPFLGSGSTGRGAVLEGFRFIGIEKDVEHGYVAIAEARIADAVREREEELAAAAAASAQLDIFATQQVPA